MNGFDAVCCAEDAPVAMAAPPRLVSSESSATTTRLSAAARACRPRVTIGLPFYNNAKTLANAIRSIFSQTCQDWELILIDDGSRDESLAIAQAVDDPRVRVLCDGRNRGLAYRLNQISQLARGEYIARMDGDDLMHPERIERETVFLDEHPEIDIVGTGIYTIDSDDRPIGLRGCQPLRLSGQAVLSQAIYEHGSVMARAEWYRKNQYDLDYNRAEDFELWCRTFTAGDTIFGKLADPLFFYREEGSVRLSKMLASYRTVQRIFSQHGPAMAERHVIRRLTAKVWMKSAAWIVASLIGMQSLILARRSRRVAPNECETARQILARIFAATVPGLDRGPCPV